VDDATAVSDIGLLPVLTAVGVPAVTILGSYFVFRVQMRAQHFKEKAGDQGLREDMAKWNETISNRLSASETRYATLDAILTTTRTDLYDTKRSFSDAQHQLEDCERRAKQIEESNAALVARVVSLESEVQSRRGA
jgi:chromosome segregation ATPase